APPKSASRYRCSSDPRRPFSTDRGPGPRSGPAASARMSCCPCACILYTPMGYMFQERRMDHARQQHSGEAQAACAHDGLSGHHHAHDVPASRQPGCGMTVDPGTSKHRFEYRGETYYFCCAGCRTKFAAEPAKYLDKSKLNETALAPEGTIYTCPMHPEIR